MGNRIKLISISSGDKPTREIIISKKWFYTGVIVIPLLSIFGFFLVFSGVLWEKKESSMHRKQMARENFELTEKIVKLKKSFFRLESQLTELKNEKTKTLAMSNIKNQDNSLVKKKENKGFIGNFFKDTCSKEKKVDILLKRTSRISKYLDSFLQIMKDKAIATHVIPTTIPVSNKSFVKRGFGLATDPFSGRRLFHSGVDFAGTPGDSIFAAGNGIVAKTGSDAFFGKKFASNMVQILQLFMLIWSQ